MGRWCLFVVLGLVACYRPSASHCAIECAGSGLCPEGLRCLGGYCTTSDEVCASGDAAVDSAIDAMNLGCTTFPSLWGNPQMLALFTEMTNVPRASYTHDLARTFAAFETTEVVGGAVDSSNLGVQVPDGAASYHAPHVNPEAHQIFVQVDDTTASFKFAIASRMNLSSEFGAPVTFEVVNGVNPVSFGATEVPGTVTAKNSFPRQMMIGVGGQFWQLEESGATWFVGPTYGAAGFDLDSIGSPSISPDGLRLVFVGRVVAGQPLAIYGAMRAAQSLRFGAAMLLHAPAAEPIHPFLSADCKHLYFYTAVNGVLKLTAL